MSDEIQNPDTLPEVDLGDGRTVISYEGGTLYRVRMPGGEVQGFRPKTEATPANAVDDIIDNPPAEPAPVVVHTPLTLISRLTDAERVAIFTSDHAAVAVWRGMAIAAQEIRTDDPRTAEGFALLVSLGLLAADRPAQLLAP